MTVTRWGWVVSAVLLGSGVGLVTSEARAQAKPEEPPALEGPLVGEPSPLPPAADSLGVQAGELEPANAPLHDVLRLSETRPKHERAPKSPPPPVAERASTDRPAPSARWFGGYWSWDPGRDDFVWVSGAWRVPPANSIWVESRWMRDAEGWYRVPGFWNPRQARTDRDAAPATATVTETTPASPDANTAGWRLSGPPADRPAESPGPAPGPDYFYIPGQYIPDGDRATWKSGFWAQVQPGWDWVPARWARQADGWHYRGGYWTRDTGPGLTDTRRHSVARPTDFPPAIIESEPATDPKTGLDDLPDSAPNTDGGPDVITEAELEPGSRVLMPPPIVIVPRRGRFAPVGPPVVVDRYRVPYRMIRPPSPLYGPSGVVVPEVTPPFVRRLLNRVLP
ncbi:hypothetical protein V5E97_22780 [Singulisphaera sp. Ch08]|uniref:BcpO-related WXXGXW repeat protein n=1 Tax=Singulisphaera sp. Ch08 TaxID=3120278 RepID=A0AAU7C7B9_9BACT